VRAVRQRSSVSNERSSLSNERSSRSNERSSRSNEGDRESILANPDTLEYDPNPLREGRTRAAVDDGQIVGFATTSGDSEVELESLFVEPSSMVGGVENGGRAGDAHTVLLPCLPSSGPAAAGHSSGDADGATHGARSMSSAKSCWVSGEGSPLSCAPPPRSWSTDTSSA
jgi:hypothetical protein